MSSLAIYETKDWFDDRIAQLDIWELTAFGIALEVRGGEAWALTHQLEFAQLAAKARVAQLVEKVFYDSNPQMHEITLVPAASISAQQAIEAIAAQTLHQFMVGAGGVGHGRRTTETSPSQEEHPDWRNAAWKAAFTAEAIEYEEFGNLLWLPQVQMWAVLETAEMSGHVIDGIRSLANRSGFPVLLLIGWPAPLGYWAIHPDNSERWEHCQQIHHQHRWFRVEDYWPFEGSGYHLTESRFYACSGTDGDHFPIPCSG